MESLNFCEQDGMSMPTSADCLSAKESSEDTVLSLWKEGK